MADVTMSDRDVQDLGAFRYLGSTPGELAGKIKKLEGDNEKQRGEIRDLTEKAKAVPAEGAVVLTGDEATEYAAWKALDVKAADVAKLKTDNAGLVEKVAKAERETAFAKVAKLSGLSEDAAAAMLDMRSLDGAVWEFKAAKVKDPTTGKEVDTEEVFVTLAGEGQKQQKFAELATTSPQLKGLPKAGIATTTQGVTVPDMRGGGGAEKTPGVGGVDDMIEANRKAASAGNPLKPAKAA